MGHLKAPDDHHHPHPESGVIQRDRTYARWVGAWGEPKMLDRILGTTTPDQHCQEAAPTRHGPLLWAHLTAAYETEFSKDAWRRPDRDRVTYLTHLVTLGYTPCDTEQRMITAGPNAVAVEVEEMDDPGDSHY